MSKVFFVLGTGRCGTSKTAKILHTKFNVFMGMRFRDDHWEDLDFKDLNDDLLDSRINFPHWYGLVTDLVEERNEKYKLWGFKDPRATVLMGIYFTLIEELRIIVCNRKEDATVKSMMKNTFWNVEVAKSVYESRMRAISNLTREFWSGFNILNLFFDTKKNDEYFEDIIKVHFKKHFE